MKEFHILGRLGEGAYSSVFRVKRLSDKKEYALKKVSYCEVRLKWASCQQKKRKTQSTRSAF